MKPFGPIKGKSRKHCIAVATGVSGTKYGVHCLTAVTERIAPHRRSADSENIKGSYCSQVAKLLNYLTGGLTTTYIK